MRPGRLGLLQAAAYRPGRARAFGDRSFSRPAAFPPAARVLAKDSGGRGNASRQPQDRREDALVVGAGPNKDRVSRRSRPGPGRWR